MKRSFVRMSLVSIGIASISAAAFADPPQILPTQGMLQGRIGLFYPSSGDARDRESAPWMSIGLTMDVPGYFNVPLTKNSMSIDWIGKGSFYSVPLMYNISTRQGPIEFGAGIGPAFVRYMDTGGDSHSAISLGYTAFASLDVVPGPLPVYLRVQYFGNSRSELSGFGVAIGARF
ncbi:MAG: hypothetical protein ABUL72_05300 [Armatimonadota bacterium]